MQVKLIELRDRMTFIPCFALKPAPGRNEFEEFLLGRSGYDPENPMIIFGRLDSGKGVSDPHDWNDRTFQQAHNWLIANWDTFTTGSVIDVQFILGETKEAKKSELIESYESIEERQHVDPS